MSRADRIASLHAQALSVFAESFARDRRVIVVGDAALGVGERLLDLGARTVHVYDTAENGDAPARAAGGPARSRLSVRPQSGDFEVRDGAFDLAVVPDLDEVDDPAALVARLRRVVSDEGALVVCGKNPQLFPGQGVDYTELYDLVALQFEHVVVSGQIAWGGVAFARLGDDGEARDVTVDSQLVGDPPGIEGYVLVASQSPIEPDPYVIVQLPDAAALAGGAPDSVEFAEVRLRAELLAAQLEEQRTLSTRLQQEAQAAARAPAPPPPSSDAVARAEARAAQAEARAQQEFARAERLVQNAKDLGDVVEEEREEAKRLVREIETERKARKKLELEAQLLREQIESADRGDRPGGIRVLSPRRGRIADVETTVAIREDDLASLADELEEVAPVSRVPDSSEAVTIPRSDQLAAKVQAEIARRSAAEERAQKLEERAAAAEARALALEERTRVVEARARETELAAARASLSDELAIKLQAAEMRAEEAEQRAEEAERRLLELEDEVARAEGRAQRAEERIARYEAEASTIGGALGEELVLYEAQLRERGKAVAELEREVARRERLVHELLSALEEAQASSALLPHPAHTNGGAQPAVPVVDPRLAEEAATARAEARRLEGKLETLSHELARYQGELFARDWRIEELEQNLALADAGSSMPPSVASPRTSDPELAELKATLAKTEEELTALRQALTQEHAARVRAETSPPQE